MLLFYYIFPIWNCSKGDTLQGISDPVLHFSYMELQPLQKVKLLDWKVPLHFSYMELQLSFLNNSLSSIRNYIFPIWNCSYFTDHTYDIASCITFFLYGIAAIYVLLFIYFLSILHFSYMELQQILPILPPDLSKNYIFPIWNCSLKFNELTVKKALYYIFPI